MKKLLLSLVIVFGLLACSKQTEDLPPSPAPVNVPVEIPVEYTDLAKRVNTTTVEDYDTRILNTCDNEWVHLTGKVKYTIKENTTEKKYTIFYEIDFRDVTGIGERSGLKYKGGGISISYCSTSFVNQSTYSFYRYSVKFTAPGNHVLRFSEQFNTVIGEDGTIMIDTNRQSEKCM